MNRKLRMGMVGGGPDAFIGDVHRKAARLDGGIDIVAGAFSSNAEKSKQMGRELCLDPSRAYESYQKMIEAELKLPSNERIDFVSIVTPNNSHFPIAKAFLEAGFDVVCDKPVTISLDEAKQLKQIIEENDRLFCLTHNYTGYPMVKLARSMVHNGDIGKVLKVVVQYPQGWLAKPLELEGAKQAQWRTNPEISGPAGCLGDIGTHTANLAEYVCGANILEVCAELTTFVEGRALDDDVSCLLHFEGGAKGLLFASQISVGKENDLAIWVHGTDGSIQWHQENPNYLEVVKISEPPVVWARGNDYVTEKSPAAARATRLPFGHPEGFIEAFANVYCNFADTLRARINKTAPDKLMTDYPGINEGVQGMAFIEAVIKSSKNNQQWQQL
ncbi:MAG: Gfo/Idh/MocA family protein [Sedimentisphaeraceae bacterium JB056]